jgi:hypothetical protein
MASLEEVDGEMRPALAVLWVTVFVFPAGIMEDGEEAHNFFIGSMQLSEVESIAPNCHPVGRTVISVLAKAELSGDQFPERFFVREKHGGINTEK